MPQEKQGFTYFRHIGGAGVVELQQKVFRLCSRITFSFQDDKVLVSVDSKDGQEVIEVDNVLGMVGYRPDTTITEELQVFTQKLHLTPSIYFPLGPLLLRH